MKKVILTVSLVLYVFYGFSQNVFSETFKPGPIIGQDAILLMMDNQCIPTPYQVSPEFLNFGNTPDIAYSDWTFNSQGCPHGSTRSILKFIELNNIPSNAIILNAELRLFGVTSGNFVPQGNNSYSGSPYPLSNEGELYKIESGVTNMWDEQTITWSSAQNLILSTNSIPIPASTSQWNWNHVVSGPDFVNMIQQMLGANNNNGFLLKLQNEAHYRSVIFASSNHADSTLWPELKIKYMIPCDPTFSFLVNINNPYEYDFTANDLNLINYDWFINNTYSGSGSNLNYTFPGPGNYQVCLSVSDNQEKCETCFNLCIADNEDIIGDLVRVEDIEEKIFYSHPSLKGDTDIYIQDKAFDIYPNPSNDRWKVSLNSMGQDKIKIQIFDITGKEIIVKYKTIKVGQNIIDIDNSKLTTGTYFIQITGRNTTIKEKAIKK